MTIVYAVSAGHTIQQLAKSVVLHSDPRWLAVLVTGMLAILAIIALVLLQLRYRTFPVMRLCAAVIAACGLVAIALRQQLLSALIVVWMVVVAYLWGDWMLRRLRGSDCAGSDDAGSGEWVAPACAIGLALLSLVPLLPGLTRKLTPTTLLLLLIGASVVQMRGMFTLAQRGWRWARAHLRIPDPGDPDQATLECLLTAIVVFNLSWALTPELSFDALNYQLAVPRFYLENHAITDLPYFWHSYFSRLVNSLFVICLGLGGPISCKLLVLATGLVTTLGVYALTANFISRSSALWAAVIFYATPMVSWLSTVSYIDLTLAMFVTTAWLAFMRWRRDQADAWLIACAILAGACVGCKPNGAYALPVMALAILGMSFRYGARQGFARVAVFGFLALVVAMPWYLLPWLWTGNPVFPLLNGVFKSPYWEPVNTMMNAGSFGIGVSIKSFVELPFLLTFRTRQFDERLSSGSLGIALILLPMGIWFMIRHRRNWTLPLALIAFYILWLGTFQYARYFMPVLPLIVAVAIGGVIEGSRSEVTRKLHVVALWVALFAQGSLLLPAFGDIVTRNPLRLILHRRSEAEYLRETLAPFRAIEYLNGVSSTSDWVIGEGVEALRYYVRPRMVSLVESRALQRQLVWRDDEELAARFSRSGYRFIIINRPLVKDKWPYLKDSFLAKFTTLEYSAESVEVYRLHMAPGEKVSSPESMQRSSAGRSGGDREIR